MNWLLKNCKTVHFKLPKECKSVLRENECFLPVERKLVGNKACKEVDRGAIVDQQMHENVEKLCLSHANYITVDEVVYKNVFCAMCVKGTQGARFVIGEPFDDSDLNFIILNISFHIYYQ